MIKYLDAKFMAYAKQIVRDAEETDTIDMLKSAVDERFNFAPRYKAVIKSYIPLMVINDTVIRVEKKMFDVVNTDKYGAGENYVKYYNTKECAKLFKTCLERFSGYELSSAFDAMDTKIKKICDKKIEKLSSCDGVKRTKVVYCTNELIGAWRKYTENSLISLGKMEGYDQNLIQDYAAGKVDLQKYVNDNFNLENRKLKRKFAEISKTK